MARVTHTAVVLLGAYGDYSVANSADYSYLAADVANMEQVVLTGKEIIIARNVDASPHTITITSVNDPFGRAENIASYSLGANEFAVFGNFQLTGWIQTDGKLYFQADNVNIEFAVLKIP